MYFVNLVKDLQKEGGIVWLAFCIIVGIAIIAVLLICGFLFGGAAGVTYLISQIN